MSEAKREVWVLETALTQRPQKAALTPRGVRPWLPSQRVTRYVPAESTQPAERAGEWVSVEELAVITAQLENVLDSSKEGSWMARALDAERELAAATARAEAAEAKLAQLLARRFPVLDGGMTVPWQMLVPHEPQAMRNHSGQTLEDLAQRCGLDWVELACVLNGKPFTHCPTEHAKEFVLKRVAEYEAAQWVREQGKGGT